MSPCLGSLRTEYAVSGSTWPPAVFVPTESVKPTSHNDIAVATLKRVTPSAELAHESRPICSHATPGLQAIP
eukprot:scaffold1618_cov397-Prasinococcus_capsulatus_cf.AAC.12